MPGRRNVAHGGIGVDASQTPVCVEGGQAPAPAGFAQDDTHKDNQPQKKAVRPRNRFSRAFFDYGLPTILGLVLAVIIFAGGFYVAKTGLIDTLIYGENASRALTVRDFANRMDEVAQILDSQALYDYDINSATASALKDLVKSSDDPYAKYYSESDYESTARVNAGEYAGLGVKIADINGYSMIYAVYDDSPAQSAGLQVGDIITGIDGDEHNWTFAEVTTALNRNLQDTVELTWFRPSDESLRAIVEAYYAASDNDLAVQGSADTDAPTVGSNQEVLSHYEGDYHTASIVYAEIVIPNISYEMKDGGVGYIALAKFNGLTATEMKTAIDTLTSEGATSLVLDLRDNPGGLVDQAVASLSLFMQDRLVMRIQYKNSVDVRKTSGAAITDLPLVVLINNDSASSSEIFAAAVQDNGRALLVGTRTYGKGVMQNTAQLSFGGAIKYTFARYLSPNGNEIDAVGITPNISIEDTRDTGTSEDAQLEAALNEARALARERS